MSIQLVCDNISPAVAVRRLRSTRSLWDKTYVDESWIGEPVNLISRMKQLLAEHYPGTKLGISEWNWGADKTLNGALAVADVLGVFGREDVYLASYWRYQNNFALAFTPSSYLQTTMIVMGTLAIHQSNRSAARPIWSAPTPA